MVIGNENYGIPYDISYPGSSSYSGASGPAGPTGRASTVSRSRSSSGSSFWDAFSSDYQPGTFEKGFQAGFGTPSQYASALRLPNISIPSMPTLQAPRISIPSYGSKPLSDVIRGIDSGSFDVEIPSISGGYSPSASPGRSKLLPIVGALVAVGVLMVFLKNRSKKQAGAAQAK